MARGPTEIEVGFERLGHVVAPKPNGTSETVVKALGGAERGSDAA